MGINQLGVDLFLFVVAQFIASGNHYAQVASGSKRDHERNKLCDYKQEEIHYSE